MRIAFFASGISPHISQICDEIYKRCGKDFIFFGTDKEPIPAMKIMGAGDLHKEKPYFININDDEEFAKLAEKWAVDADVAIVGCSNCYKYLDMRFEHGNRLTFKLRERIFKSGRFEENDEKTRRKIEKIRKHKDRNLYFLAAGTFAPIDLKMVGVPENKIIKWGYFPAVSDIAIEEMRRDEAGTIQLIWFGRFVPEKLSLNAVIATQKLLELGYDVLLSVIGYGEEEEILKTYVYNNHLENRVLFLGAMDEKNIRNKLRESHLFLMTSNYEEGWGAVVNEAMSEGCVPIVSYATGASQIIIDNNVSGQLFFSTDIDDLVTKIREVLDNRCLLHDYSINSYNQIVKEWNAEVAVKRLFEIIDNIHNEQELPKYKTGPCGTINYFQNEQEVDEWLRSEEM